MVELTQARELYGTVSDIFARYQHIHIDAQTALNEKVEIIETALGRKPSFLAVTVSEDRKALFLLVKEVLDRFGISNGFADLLITYPYRSLKIPNYEIANAVQAKIRQEVAPIFWMSDDAGLVSAYSSRMIETLDDVARLGIPTCCANWHYDCYYARGLEAFVDVYLKQMSPNEICKYIREEWCFSSGFFFPQEFFVAAILRSNSRFPMIGHVACPQCLAGPASLSAKINAQSSQIASEFESICYDSVLNWSRGLQSTIQDLIAHPRGQLEKTADELTTNVRSRDTYLKHGRHLLKALGL